MDRSRGGTEPRWSEAEEVGWSRGRAEQRWDGAEVRRSRGGAEPRWV